MQIVIDIQTTEPLNIKEFKIEFAICGYFNVTVISINHLMDGYFVHIHVLRAFGQQWIDFLPCFDDFENL